MWQPIRRRSIAVLQPALAILAVPPIWSIRVRVAPGEPLVRCGLCLADVRAVRFISRAASASASVWPFLWSPPIGPLHAHTRRYRDPEVTMNQSIIHPIVVATEFGAGSNLPAEVAELTERAKGPMPRPRSRRRPGRRTTPIGATSKHGARPVASRACRRTRSAPCSPISRRMAER
jgi:hypothetical protein